MTCGSGVRSNSGRSERFTDYQRKVVVLNCLQARLMLVSVYCICVLIEVLTDIKLMCENEPVILSLVIILLTIIIPSEQFFDFIKQSGATRHPSQLNGRNYRVRHILCRRTPPPPKLNLPLINFGVINFFVDLGPSPVSWTVVSRFNRVGSYIPENSTVMVSDLDSLLFNVSVTLNGRRISHFYSA